MKKIKKILVIIQRSNGDVFLSYSLIQSLQTHFKRATIDLLVNDDTISVANLMPNIGNVFSFSYQRKKDEKIKQEFEIISKIYSTIYFFKILVYIKKLLLPPLSLVCSLAGAYETKDFITPSLFLLFLFS